MPRYMVFFVACALPLLLVGQIAPNMARELDFWLMWLVAMALVGLPVLFAEFALSARSASLPWQGMQKLTREADAGLIWRSFAVLSVLLALLLSGSIASRIATGAMAQFGDVLWQTGIPTQAMAMGIMAIALILSLLGTRLLPVGVLLIVLGAVLALFDSSVSIPVMTAFSLTEWSHAVLLALLCIGAGTGLYWFGSMHTAPNLLQNKKSLAGYTLPIWLTQLVFGSLAILAGSAMVAIPSFVVSSLGMLLLAAFLLHYAAVQLSARFGLMIAVAAMVLFGFSFSIIPSKPLFTIIIILSLLSALILSVFSGFAMKISHLRKTLNLKSELRYNLWRVLVRIIVPVAIILAIIGLVLDLLA